MSIDQIYPAIEYTAHVVHQSKESQPSQAAVHKQINVAVLRRLTLAVRAEKDRLADFILLKNRCKNTFEAVNGVYFAHLPVTFFPVFTCDYPFVRVEIFFRQYGPGKEYRNIPAIMTA